MANLIYEGTFDKGVYKIKGKTVEFLNIDKFNDREITYREDYIILKAQKLKSGTVRLYANLVESDIDFRSKYLSKVCISDNMITELQLKNIILLHD